MQFKYSDLGHLPAGSVVRVEIRGDGPNVRLMDSSNFRAFKNGGNGRAVGGRALRSPVTLTVPHTGNWYLVIDFGGYAGNATYSFQVLRATG